MPYRTREHKQRKRNLTEEKNVMISSFPIVSTAISKKKKDWFQLWVHIYNSE